MSSDDDSKFSNCLLSDSNVLMEVNDEGTMGYITLPDNKTALIVETNKLYNINADEAASNLAIAMSAEKFVVLTNVRGVMKDKDEPGSLFHSLTMETAMHLIKTGVIEGGMVPKIRACLHALAGGALKAHIVDANLSHALLLEMFTDKGIGTEIVKG